MKINSNLKLILGSSSQWRQAILRQTGLNFTVLSPDIDEKAIRAAEPEKMVLAIATAKAQALLDQINEPAILITADQVVRCQTEIREKPQSPAECLRFWQDYNQGYPAETISAVVVTNTQTKAQASGVAIAKIYYHPVPESVISEMIVNGLVLKAAGGFIHEDPLVAPYIKKIEGASDSIDGMPLALLEELINKVI